MVQLVTVPSDIAPTGVLKYCTDVFPIMHLQQWHVSLQP